MITELYSYSTNEYQNVIKIYVFHKGTELDDYYVSTDKIDKDMVEALAEYGIC